MRARMLLATMLLISSPAMAAGGRSLPTGELSPQVVERVFESPAGEVQFTGGAGGPGAFLRSESGAVTALSDVKGPFACEQWMAEATTEAPPEGCEFFFANDGDERETSVRAGEMREGDLFGAVRGTMRGQSRHVTI